MKRYTLYYTSDKRDRLSNIGEYLHEYGKASSLKTIKQYANRVKADQADYNPRDFFYTDQEHEFPLAEENRVYLDHPKRETTMSSPRTIEIIFVPDAEKVEQAVKAAAPAFLRLARKKQADEKTLVTLKDGPPAA